MTIPRQTANALRFETPTAKDGAAMWELVSRSTLDQNSAYKYIMMGHYFAETCVLAKADNKLAGFATAFIPPGQEDVVFIWQIGVDSSQRGKGLATKMINELIQREVCKNVRYVEATITLQTKHLNHCSAAWRESIRPIVK